MAVKSHHPRHDTPLILKARRTLSQPQGAHSNSELRKRSAYPPGLSSSRLSIGLKAETKAVVGSQSSEKRKCFYPDSGVWI